MSTHHPRLLACPFCGETPDANDPHTFRSDQGGKWGYVVCCGNGPEVRTGYRPVEEWKDAAIAAWNRRALAPIASTCAEGATEEETLRQQQAGAVMPLIGPLLDAWDGTPNDEKNHDSPLYRAMEQIARAMEGHVSAPPPTEGEPPKAADELLEMAARVALAHKRSAANRRTRKLSSYDEDTRNEIIAEERGEDIAADIIAAAIRNLKSSHVLKRDGVVVPREPSEEMLNAARDWSLKKYGLGIGNDAAIGCYKAMIAAASAQEVDSAIAANGGKG